MSVHEHYKAVLQDLLLKRAERRRKLDDLNAQVEELAKEIVSIDSALSTIDEFMPLPTLPAETEPTTILFKNPDLQPYTAMSMRWAILKLLSGRGEESLTTGTVVVALVGGGFNPTTNFSSKVSAILGQMVGKGELERGSEGWHITPSGFRQWTAISDSERYRNRGTSMVPSERDEQTTELEPD